MKYVALALMLLFSPVVFAQQFLKTTTPHRMTLREINQKYHQWKNSPAAKTQPRSDEAFNEWREEMERYTNGHGEPGDATAYLHAAVNAAKSRTSALATGRMPSTGWYPVGPDVLGTNNTGYSPTGMGRINCVTFSPTDSNTYYVGVAQGGVWKTTDDGNSWTPLTDNLPIDRISDIALDPAHPDSVMYISVCDFEYIGYGLYEADVIRNTHYGLGVYKTTDGGQTWNPTGLTFQMTKFDGSLIRRIIVDPNGSDTLLACGVSGMYRSTDAGANWTMVQQGLFWDMQEDKSTDTLYAATGQVQVENAGSAGIYKSTDFGATWTLLNTGMPATGSIQRVKLAIAPSNPNYVYAVAVDNNSGLYGVYKSTDAGTNWTEINNGSVNFMDWSKGTNSGGQGTYDLGLCVNDTNENTVFVGGVNIWGSSDGGSTWNPASNWTFQNGPTLHCDIHYIAQQPQTGRYFVCSDGGIYRTPNIIPESWSAASTTNWPTQWTNISSGMQITAFYRISSSENAMDRLVGGAQDNASFYYKNGAWSTIDGGDGMDNYLDPTNDQMVIASAEYGSFMRSLDDGMSDAGMNPNQNNENACWTTPLTADYNNQGDLYTGFENVYKSTNSGVSWTKISNFSFANYAAEISAIAVSNSDANLIYAAKRVRYSHNEPAHLYKTTNGGSSWTDVTSNLPDSLYYSSVEVSESDTSTAYVTMSGFEAADKVYETNDGGQTWKNITYNLPNIPINCIKYIPGSNGEVMLATDIGVYVKQPLDTAWTSYSTGLPNVIITDIEFNTTTNKVYIATFGRGIWGSDLGVFAGVQQSPKPELSANLYPSPNNGEFTIQIPAMYSSETTNLNILDVMGKVVYSQKLSGQSNYTIHAHLAAGMYFARLEGKDVKGVKRFVVK